MKMGSLYEHPVDIAAITAADRKRCRWTSRRRNRSHCRLL